MLQKRPSSCGILYANWYNKKVKLKTVKNHKKMTHSLIKLQNKE